MAALVAAVASGFTALALVITAVSAGLASRASSRRQDAYHRENAAKLDVIHRQGNSVLTEALRAHLATLNRELILMHELLAVRAAGGTPPTGDQQAALAAAEKRVADLTEAMIAREAQARGDRQE